MQQQEKRTDTTTVQSSGGTTTTGPSSSTTAGSKSSESGGTTTTSPSTTRTTTTSDPYKTEFVKVYQDAGVIGAAMLTLLVICALLATLAFRLAKMYTSLVTSRDNLDGTRTAVLEKLTETVLTVKAEVSTIDGQVDTVRQEILRNRDENVRGKDTLLSEMRRLCDRFDQLEPGRSPSSGHRGRS